MNRRLLAAGLATLMAIVPLSSATWIGSGDVEPSTRYDTPEYMFADPNEGPLNKVYFNGFQMQYVTGINPNSAALSSDMRAYGAERVAAMLGVWRDCNQDGYIGFGEQAVTEYRSELLLDSSICPAEAGNNLAHNDGEWVYELLKIADVDPCSWASASERAAGSGSHCAGQSNFNSLIAGTFYTNGTRVWGDRFRPDLKADFVGSTCPINPVPEGTTGHSGLLIRYAGCFGGTLRTANANLETVDATAEEQTGTNPGLAFTDGRNPQKDTDHPLIFQMPVNLYGYGKDENRQTGLIEYGSGDPAFTVYDCNGDATASVDDPTYGAGNNPANANDEDGLLHNYGDLQDPTETPELKDLEVTDEEGYITRGGNFSDEDGNVVRVPALGVAPGNPTGSYYDALGEVDDECSETNGLGNSNQKGTLDNPSSDSSSQATGKRTPDWTLTFGGLTLSWRPSALVTELGARTPDVAQYFYHGQTNLVGGAPFVIRSDLEPQAPGYYSFYAFIPPSDLAAKNLVLPSGAVGTYGDVQCPAIGPGAPITNGWECDPDNWYRTAVDNRVVPRYRGTTENPGARTGALVGDDYQLRDVDCYGQSIGGVTIGVNLQSCDVFPEA